MKNTISGEMPLKVLMLTRKVDLDDPLYSGFTHDWIVKLAARVKLVDVICQQSGTTDLPGNVRLTEVRGTKAMSRPRLLLAFQKAIWRSIAEVDVVFSHVSPHYAIAVIPAAKLFRKPIVQWHTLGHVRTSMRLAHRFVRRVVTASPESYRIPSKKVTVLGHGIDFGQFSPASPDAVTSSTHRQQILTVGRITHDKDFATQIRAAALLLHRPEFDKVQFVLAGDEPSWASGERSKLETLIADLDLEGRFRLLGGVPYSEIVELYQASTVVVSTSRVGAIDKVPLEAMGCGLPVVLTEPAYASILGQEQSLLLARAGDPQDLADKLAHLLTMDPEELRKLGLKLRARAVRQHDLEGLMDRLVAVLYEEVNRATTSHRRG